MVGRDEGLTGGKAGLTRAVERVELRTAPARAHLYRRFRHMINLPFVKRPRRIMRIYNQAGGTLLAEGLAYSALFAGLTGLLLIVALLGYFVPTDADQQKIIDSFTGELSPFGSFVGSSLSTMAANAGALSIAGFASLAWGASQFYGALDRAISRIFERTQARGTVGRVIRGFVSLFLLAGGLATGVLISAVGAWLRAQLHAGEDLLQLFDAVAFPAMTGVVVIAAVAIVYRVVPNTTVPIRVLRVPALVVGVAITVLGNLLVFLAPLLTGWLKVFGGVAAVFATLAWLHLVFQVLLIGAAWTRVRLEDIEGSRV